jgi:hypothetical protein
MKFVECELARTTFGETHVKVMRSGITLRSPSATEQQSSDSVDISECTEDEPSSNATLSFSACSEQTARHAANSHKRHIGNVTAKPRFNKAFIGGQYTPNGSKKPWIRSETKRPPTIIACKRVSSLASLC